MSSKRINVEDVAKICHETNRAYCETLGDSSQMSWDQASGWQRDSAMEGVKAHLISDLTPEQSHEAWIAHKEKDGWIYGRTKNEFLKTHPCMVPYDQLPEDQKLKDKLFRAVVGVFK